MLNQDSVFHADNIRRNPVHRQPEVREPAVDNDEVSLCYDYTWLILERDGRLLIKLNKPSRPGSICALC